MSDRVIDNPLYQGMSLKSLLETTDMFQIPGLMMDGSEGVKKDVIKKDGSDLYKPTAAFLGPDLWDNTQKMSLEYMDLDEFLSENNIPLELCMSPNQQQEQRLSSPPVSPNRLPGILMDRDASPMRTVVCGSPDNLSPQTILRGDSPLQFINPSIVEQKYASPEPDNFRREMSPDYDTDSLPAESSSMSPVRPGTTNSNFVIKVSARPTISSVPVTNVPRIWTPRKMVDVDFKVDEADLALATVPGIDFDPRKRAFSSDELKPQPMIKKSRKQYVPSDLKDEHYWARRNKNNYAAKRSREARRMKENQIAMRANFLEKENATLSMELTKCKSELNLLKKRLTMFESTHHK